MGRRRRNQEEEHENHERWLVSYADFITLLFAFFVVMYAISQVNEGKYRTLSNSLVNAFGTSLIESKTPGSANTLIEAPEAQHIARTVKTQPLPPAQARAQALQKSLEKIVGPLMKSGQVQLYRTDEGLHLDIKDSALFAVGQATPSPESVRLINAVSGVLAPLDNPIKVEGFTDDIPIRNAVYPSNWELSAARAGSVVRLFQENGIAADRLVAVGRAENRPLASNTTEAGRAQNRRVAITVVARSQAELDVLPDEMKTPAPVAPPPTTEEPQ